MRTLAPDGHLHTFDFHAKRTEKARQVKSALLAIVQRSPYYPWRQEFEEHGLGHLVTATHRDVCAEGFGLENRADGVFLDLPHPWEVISHAKMAMKVTEQKSFFLGPSGAQSQSIGYQSVLPLS